MNVRSDLDVTLPHDMAQQVAKMLTEYADHERDAARRCKQPAVRACVERGAEDARRVAQYITERLWVWADDRAHDYVDRTPLDDPAWVAAVVTERDALRQEVANLRQRLHATGKAG